VILKSRMDLFDLFKVILRCRTTDTKDLSYQIFTVFFVAIIRSVIALNKVTNYEIIRINRHRLALENCFVDKGTRKNLFLS